MDKVFLISFAMPVWLEVGTGPPVKRELLAKGIGRTRGEALACARRHLEWTYKRAQMPILGYEVETVIGEPVVIGKRPLAA